MSLPRGAGIATVVVGGLPLADEIFENVVAPAGVAWGLTLMITLCVDGEIYFGEMLAFAGQCILN